MEMEWRKKRQIKWKQNLIGMEQKWNGKELKTWVKYYFVKWIWKWNGMDMEWRWN